MKAFIVPKLICLTGLPLSGKSHLGKVLCKHLPKSTYIATGDIVREIISSPEDKQQLEATDLFHKEDLLRSKVQTLIDKAVADGFTAIILDGAPRHAEQVLWVNTTFHHMAPIVLDVNAGAITTLLERARFRKRDDIDSDMSKIAKRLSLAIPIHGKVHEALNRIGIPIYTILSTGDTEFILQQLNKILKKEVS